MASCLECGQFDNKEICSECGDKYIKLTKNHKGDGIVKEYTLSSRDGERVVKLSGKNIFGLWCYLYSKGFKHVK